MEIFLTLLILCTLMFLICYVGTGGEKNIKSLSSYPDEVIEIIKSRPEYKDKIKKPSGEAAGFMMNILIYSVILFIFGLPVKTSHFLANFIRLSILGQGVNLFDLLVIDLIWWTHTKRVRFKGTENDDKLYKNPKKHIISFLKGIALFIIVAVVDGFLLTLIGA